MSERKKCRWVQDEWEGSWNTSCGHSFSIIDGTPTDNDMKFCCYCGGSIPPQPAPPAPPKRFEPHTNEGTEETK